MALCCQNQEYRGTGQHYGLHSSASVSVHSTFVMVLDFLKKKEMKELVQNGVFFAIFRLAVTCMHVSSCQQSCMVVHSVCTSTLQLHRGISTLVIHL